MIVDDQPRYASSGMLVTAVGGVHGCEHFVNQDFRSRQPMRSLANAALYSRSVSDHTLNRVGVSGLGRTVR